MALQIGNREKLAALTIVGLVAIGLLHYFLFMERARSYNKAFTDYNDARARYKGTVVESQRPQIMEYINANTQMEAYMMDLMSGLGIDWPEVFFPEAGDEAVQKRQDRFLELIEDTAKLRQTHSKIKLPFLDWNDGEGWDIPASLPPSVATQILWDKIEQLKVTAMELRVLNDPMEMARKRLVYNRQLMEIGLDPNRLLPESPALPTVANHGPLVPLIKKLAHARLIWERKEQDQKTAGADRIPISTKEELYKLLEIDLPDDPTLLFYAIKQLEFLHRLIGIAEKQGVEEIRAVKLMPVRKVDMIADPDNPGKQIMVPEIYMTRLPFGRSVRGAGYGVRVPYGGGVGPNMNPDYNDYSDYGDDRYSDAEAYRPTPAAPLPGALGATATPAKPPDPLTAAVVPTAVKYANGTYIGDVTPIQVMIFATWETSLKFLYTITHNQNPYEIDSMQMATSPGEGGRITTAVTLVPMAKVEGVKGFFAPAPVAAANPTGTPPPVGRP